MFRNTLDDGNSTAIYFLLEVGKSTKLHRLPGTEVFHFYMGDPAMIHLLGPGREYGDVTLGTDLEEGHQPQVIVPGNTWQAAETLGEWTLLGTTRAPGFNPEEFELGNREALVAEHPDAAQFIVDYTPD